MSAACEQIGGGPSKVLVLHGWFGDERSFDAMRPSLSADEFTYCCVAYRGYGRNRGATGEYTLDEIAQDALDVADSLGWDRFSLIGHSMGAKAAQKLLLKDPRRVRELIAIAPVPASSVPFDADGWALFSGAATDESKRAAILDFSTGKRLARTWIDRQARRSMESTDSAAFAAYLHAWALTDFSAEVKGLSTPLHIIVGEHDPHLTADLMQHTYLAWYPNASIEVMSNCGHYPMDEAPIALATSIERFLQALSGSCSK